MSHTSPDDDYFFIFFNFPSLSFWICFTCSYFSSLVCAHVSPPLSLSPPSPSVCFHSYITNDCDDHVFGWKVECVLHIIIDGMFVKIFVRFIFIKNIVTFNICLRTCPVHCDYQQLKWAIALFFQSTPHMSIIFNMWLKSFSVFHYNNSQITCFSSAHFTINPLIKKWVRYLEMEAKKIQ